MPLLGDLEDDLVGRLLSVDGSDRGGFHFYDSIELNDPRRKDVITALAKLHDEGIIECDSPLESQPFSEANLRLTPSGRMYALLNEGRILRTVMAGTSESILDVADAFFQLRDRVHIVDSTLWTGLTHSLGLKKVTQIRENVVSLISSIEQAEMPERDRANAMHRAAAIKELVNSPDTPWRVVTDLLNSAPLTAFLNTAAIFAIIKSVF